MKTIIYFVNYYFISVSFSITVVSFVSFRLSNILSFLFISVYEIVFSSIVFVLVLVFIYENNLG